MDIEKEFKRLVEYEVKNRLEESEFYKDKYNELIGMIKHLTEVGRSLQHSSIKDNLPIGAAEAEGYVRFGVEILSWIGDE